MTNSEPPHACRSAETVLLLGYGNELRGDDAVGPRVAATVEGWKLPGVRSLALHQLTPELADPISRAEAVIFVDATASPTVTETAAIPLEPVSQSELAAHTSDPRTLLALALPLFGRCPPAWLIQIPVEQFVLGQPLSATATRGVAAALESIRRLMQTYPAPLV